MILRKVEWDKDREAIKEVYREIFLQDYSFWECSEERLEAVLESVQASCGKADRVARVAVEGSSIIGFALGSIRPFFEKSYGLIEMLYVREDFRNRGYAKLLLEAIENFFRQFGILYIQLHVTNAEARQLYEKSGYVEERVVMKKLLTEKV